MSLHDRVLDLLEGRIKMGAGVKAGVRAQGRRRKAGVKAGVRAAGKRTKAVPKKRAANPKMKTPSSKGRKTKSCSDWIEYVKEFAKLNNITYKQALQEASPHYKRAKAQGTL